MRRRQQRQRKLRSPRQMPRSQQLLRQVALPVQYAQTSQYWPQTRYEWSVIASMMVAIENSLNDFEREVDQGEFRNLSQASERAGRLLGESVVVQSVIYAMMKDDDDDDEDSGE